MTIANRYNLIKQLGEGGFGEVWLAEDTMTSTQVALKLYKVNSRGHDELVREYRLVAGLKHPNLLTASYVGRDDSQGISFLEMDYCRYGSLEDKIGTISEQELWRCIRDMASGLQALVSNTVFDEKASKEVSAPVVHQDIKPANILIRRHKNNGDAIYAIADFGISKMNISQRSGSTLFSSAGTLSYMAPERFKPDYHPIVESDIWSLGAMLYELVEGRPPFPNMDGLCGGNWLNQQGVATPPFHSKVSKKLQDLVYECLSKEIDKRPSADRLFEVACETITLLGKMESDKNYLISSIMYALIERKENETVGCTDKKKNVYDYGTATRIHCPPKVENKLFETKYDSANNIVFSIDGISFKMIFLEEGLLHGGHVSSFYIGETVVTRPLYNFVIYGDKEKGQKHLFANWPAGLNWHESSGFAATLSKLTGYHFRLPTINEWEYAARGGKRSRGFIYSGSNDLKTVGWKDSFISFKRGAGLPRTVGLLKPNEAGLYDMSGNIWEWCDKEAGEYLACGGDIMSSPSRCQVNSRKSFNPEYPGCWIGLRLALDYPA